jgi:tetratricopeptide (TPR) repeat protein
MRKLSGFAQPLLGVLLWLWPLASVAQSDVPLCDEFSMGGVEEAMRANPGHDKRCHALGMALIRQAGPHDYRLFRAEAIFRTLLRLRPRAPFATIGFAELKMRRRELGLKGEGAASAIHEEAERATRIRPVLPEAYVTLGRAELLDGCLPCAERSAGLARQLGVDSPELALLRSRIDEQAGKPEEARAVLEGAIAAPGLAQEPRAWLQVALAELQVRSGKLDDADRLFAEAAGSQPDNVSAIIRRAQVRLFEGGDLQGALDVGTANRRAAASAEIKRMRAIAGYLAWSRDRSAGRASEQDLRRIAQSSYLSPEGALVVCARHPALASETEVMLAAGVAGRVDERDEAGDTALISAAAGGNARVARLLVARKADVDAEGRYGRRPLSYAADRSDHELLELLLRAGAVVDYADKDGRSPLLSAVQRRDSVATGLLLLHRAKRSTAPPGHAGDLLTAAAKSDDSATLQALLDSGIPVDTVDGRGSTALVVAVHWGSRQAVRLLLGRGADAAKALDAARDRGDEELIRLLSSSLKRST